MGEFKGTSWSTFHAADECAHLTTGVLTSQSASSSAYALRSGYTHIKCIKFNP